MSLLHEYIKVYIIILILIFPIFSYSIYLFIYLDDYAVAYYMWQYEDGYGCSAYKAGLSATCYCAWIIILYIWITV